MGGACYKSGAQWASKEEKKALKRAGRALETPGRASEAVGGHSWE